MLQLDDETLQRYHDGDLTPLEERVVVRMIHTSGMVDLAEDVAFTPGPTEVLGDEFVFEISDLAPGETGVIAGEMQAQEYWHQPGTARWRVLNEDGNETGSGQVEFATMVWP